MAEVQEDSEPHGAGRAAAARWGEVGRAEEVLGKVEDKSGDVAEDVYDDNSGQCDSGAG